MKEKTLTSNGDSRRLTGSVSIAILMLSDVHRIPTLVLRSPRLAVALARPEVNWQLWVRLARC